MIKKTDFYSSITTTGPTNSRDYWFKFRNFNNGFPLSFGICGGMCFAALDYYHYKNDRVFPKHTRIPKRLMPFLARRQLASLRRVWPPKLREWMGMDENERRRRTGEESLPEVTLGIDQDTEAVLCMIQGGGNNRITKNHVVVACAYEPWFTDASGKQMTRIYGYDPNQGDEQHLKIEIEKEETASGPIYKLEKSDGQDLWGFYVIGYEDKRPPNLNGGK